MMQTHEANKHFINEFFFWVPVMGMLAGVNLSKAGMNLLKAGRNPVKQGKHRNHVIVIDHRNIALMWSVDVKRHARSSCDTWNLQNIYDIYHMHVHGRSLQCNDIYAHGIGRNPAVSLFHPELASLRLGHW